MSRQHGFTLLELMIAILIGVLLMSLAVPSVTGMLREQRLKQTMEDFNDFVRKAQSRAVGDHRTQVLVWGEAGIELISYDPTVEGEATPAERYEFPADSKITLERPAALVKKPVWEWPFWRSGACEPVIVNFESPAGTWSMEYNGLTGRGHVLAMEVK